MKKNMVFVAAVSAMMFMAATAAVLFSGSDESEAVAPSWSISVYKDNAWTTYSGSGFNGCIAAQSAGIPGLVIDSAYTVEKTNAWGTYWTISDRYGLVTEIDGVANGDIIAGTTPGVWNLAVYTNGAWDDQRNQYGDPSDPDDGVNSTQAALGFYRPYSDYNADWKTGTVALWFGEDDSSMPAGLSVTAAPIVTVTNTAEFRVQFSMRCYDVVQHGFGYLWQNVSVAPTWVQGVNGLPVYVHNLTFVATGFLNTTLNFYGYGSDAYLALRNALNANGTNVVGNDTPGEYYSWLVSIFGLSQSQVEGADTPDDYTDDHYVYWSQYGKETSGGDWAYAPFVIGHYSPVSGAPVPVDGPNGTVLLPNQFKVSYDWS